MDKRVGDVSPGEYDWQEQFGGLDVLDHGPFVQMDVGKVRGLAFALQEALAALAALEGELDEERVTSATALAAKDEEIERLRALLEGDCPHGYFRGGGCGICGDPIQALRARLAAAHAIYEALTEEGVRWVREDGGENKLAVAIANYRRILDV